MLRARSPLVLAALVAGAVIVVVAVFVGSGGGGGPQATPTPGPTAGVLPTPSSAIETPTPSASPAASESAPLESAVPPPPVDEGTPEPCGTFDPRCNRMPVDGAGAVFTPDLPCGELGTCQLGMGVAHPRSGGPWPVIVMVPGGPRAPDADQYLGDFAGSVASQGAVVFVARYRETPQWGGGYPATYRDIGCAIRFARENAAQWGGDASRVTLVAHSFGTFVGAVVALSPDVYEPDPGTCLTTTGSTRPDAFVGIAGVYSQADVSAETLTSFFGGTKEQAPQAWAAGDPYALVAAKSNVGLPIRLIQGTIDTNVLPRSAQEFQQALSDAGYDSTLTMVERADHAGVLQNHHTIETVMETALGLEP